MEPLVDFNARTLRVSHASLDHTLDALFRMNGDSKRWRDCITLYVGPFDNAASSIGRIEALALCGVFRSLRSPVCTVGIGLLSQHQSLLVAAGQRGLRFVLPHSLLCVGSEETENLRLPNGSLGLLNTTIGSSLRTQADELLCAEFQQLLDKLGLNRELWKKPTVLTASQAIAVGIADSLIPSINQKQQQPTIPSTTRDHEAIR